jgi:hypothetical protein
VPFRHGDAGDLWHAMARLHVAHPEPVGLSVPFERPSARLSIADPNDILLSARVELFEDEPVRRLHDVIDMVSRRLAGDGGLGEYALVPDVALELVIGIRQELPLHTAQSQASPGSCGKPSAPSARPARPERDAAVTAPGPARPARCGSRRSQPATTSRNSRTARSR